MATLASRSSARRPVKKAGSSPIPCGPMGGSTCGHSNCTGGTCQVRYVGPTSHLRDHHIMHAAYGATHIWSAAIIAGLAVVVTGTLAFTAVQAKSDQELSALRNDSPTQSDWSRVMAQITQMQQDLESVKAACGVRVPASITP